MESHDILMISVGVIGLFIMSIPLIGSIIFRHEMKKEESIKGKEW